MNSQQIGVYKDCLRLVDHTLFQFHSAYYLLYHVSLRNHINLLESHLSTDKDHVFQPTLANLKALLNATMTNQDTCLIGLSRARLTEDLRRRAGEKFILMSRRESFKFGESRG
ncbi:hypothetical protein AMTR_s00006p00031280 [Amborella trichopoda]|uniref:Pectinesterase inhibitor domain-containing protein n=1 Tax=Amborella trichopoda TaxID=13333 RepID=W1PD32_AMBTC|nr:hypothetical protein AMTR_s00006p00031280 [Amborella trichopoda]